MSERVPQPTEADLCNWASGGGAYPSADPGVPARDAGFKPINNPVAGPGAIIPANDHNFLWRLGMEMLTWLRDSIPREWTELNEAIKTAGSATRVLLRVTPLLVGGMWPRLQQAWNIAAPGTGSGGPKQICTDGEQLYYHFNSITDYVVGANPITGALVWERAFPISKGPSALACDGDYVFHTAATVDAGLRKISRTTGADVSVGGTEYGCSEIRVNGAKGAGIAPVGGAGKVVFWNTGTLAAAPTETATQTPTTALGGVAIDADQVYVGGTRNTQDVWAYKNNGTALAFAIILPTTTAPTVADIAADGNVVYVATNSVTLTAGGTASLFCLDRVAGTLLWTLDTVDLVKVAVDDQHLFVIDTSDNLIMFQLKGAVVSQVMTIADWDEVVCDGVSVVGHDATTTANYMRHMLGGPSKTFMRALGSDPSRRPFFTLAIPTGQG